MSRILFTLIAITVLNASTANAESTTNTFTPKLSISFAEGFGVGFNDDNDASPGSITTRLMIGLGWALPENFGVGIAAGLCTPNDTFRPTPRIAIAASYNIGNIGLSIASIYQYNPSYADKTDSHTLIASAGVGYKLAPWFAVGLDIGPGWTIDHPGWSLVFQPKVALAF